MKISLPGIEDQKKVIFEESTKEAIKQLKENLKAPVVVQPLEVDESQFSNDHLLREREGWQAPDADLVAAYFRQFQAAIPDYDTDKKLAVLLGLSSDRRVREFKNGSRKVPYGVWRKFLVLTGRAAQDVEKVLAFIVSEDLNESGQ